MVAHQLRIYAITKTMQCQLLNFPNTRRTVVGNTDMHVCFSKRLGNCTAPFARQSNDAHISFMRSMKRAY